MIVELKDKVRAGVSTASINSTTSGAVRDQVLAALVGLGFPTKQAEQAVDAVLADTPDAATAVALRTALNSLGRQR